MVHSVFFNENIWLAIFADVGVALLAVLNASRLSRMNPEYGMEEDRRQTRSEVTK